MKKVFFLVLLAGFMFTSCEKDADLRDEYVGEWSADVTGTVVMTMEDEPMGEFPMNIEEKMNISKVTTTDDELNIDGLVCKLKGKELIFEDETSNSTVNGTQTQLTIKRTGTAEKNKIVINETYEGTWSMMMMMSGTISGTTVITLTK